MRKTAIIIRGMVLTLAIRSDIYSEYRSNIKISTYKDIFKLTLDYYSPVLEQFIREYLVPTGLYRRSFRNSVGEVIIYKEMDILPRSDIEKTFLKFVRGTEYAKRPSETELRTIHGDVPVLM